MTMTNFWFGGRMARRVGYIMKMKSLSSSFIAGEQVGWSLDMMNVFSFLKGNKFKRSHQLANLLTLRFDIPLSRSVLSPLNNLQFLSIISWSLISLDPLLPCLDVDFLAFLFKIHREK